MSRRSIGDTEYFRRSKINGTTTNLYSEILSNLFMGGTDDSDVISIPKRLRHLTEQPEFDSVVTLYSYAQPMSWYVHENRFGFVDGPLDAPTIQKVEELAEWLHGQWKIGKKCLVRCQAGLNRSGAVMARVLMKEGYTAGEAIQLIREKRSSDALCNRDFVKWLMRSDAIGQRQH